MCNYVHCQGKAEKNPLLWRCSGSFGFSQERLFSRNSTRKPLNLINNRFLQKPLVNPFVFRMPPVCTLLIWVLIVFWGCPKNPIFETSPTPYRRLWALRARSVLGSVRENVPENRGVRESVQGSVSGIWEQQWWLPRTHIGSVSLVLKAELTSRCVPSGATHCLWYVEQGDSQTWQTNDTVTPEVAGKVTTLLHIQRTQDQEKTLSGHERACNGVRI